MEFYEDRFKKTKKRSFCISLSHHFVRADKNSITLTAFIKTQFKNPVDLSKFTLKIGEFEHDFKLRLFNDNGKPSKSHSGIIKIRIEKSDLPKFKKHNLICLHNKSDNSILYNAKNDSYKRRSSKMLVDRQNNIVGYFRESITGKLMFTTREASVTDRFSGRLKIGCAYYLAKFKNRFTKNQPILFYEKFGRYEEGTSILFEYMMDEGYDNIYCIANDSYLPDSLDGKYKKNIIPQFSFRHYLYYFMSDTFISSEPITYAVDINSRSFKIWKHCRKGYGKTTHIHLQHGISYMISFGSANRSGARKTSKSDFYREVYVVSSQKEADHLMKYGHYDADELYFAGMPKFDRAILYEGADKIFIMPTWRPWELNTILNDPKSSTYYNFVKNLIDAVPDELKDKVIVRPHPFFNQIFKNEINEEYTSYDEILRNTRLLITDYSSIAYDAFYRGSNVIFDWSEKDYCMEQYGKNTFLMLTEDDAFGYITYDREELSDRITQAYHEAQKPEFIDNFKTIVEFDDNRNCQRMIECMKKDGIL